MIKVHIKRMHVIIVVIIACAIAGASIMMITSTVFYDCSFLASNDKQIVLVVQSWKCIYRKSLLTVITDSILWKTTASASNAIPEVEYSTYIIYYDANDCRWLTQTLDIEYKMISLTMHRDRLFALCSVDFSDPDKGKLLYSLDDLKAAVVPLDIANMIYKDTNGMTRDELFSKAGWTYDDTLSSQSCKKFANMVLLKNIPKNDIVLSIALNRLETTVSYGFISHGEKKCDVTIPLK